MQKMLYLILLCAQIVWGIVFLEEKSHHTPEIKLIEASNDGDSIDVHLGFYDQDIVDVWQAIWCLGNEDKPNLCYEDSLAIVFPNIINKLAYKSFMTGTWWILLRDLYGLKTMAKLVLPTTNIRDNLLTSYYKDENDYYHITMNINESLLPVNVSIIDNSSHRYQYAFITKGHKEITLLASGNLKLNISHHNITYSMDLPNI